MNHLKMLSTLFGVLILSGCASSTLRLSLDIYSEDVVRSTPLTETQIAELLLSLEELRVQAEELVDARLSLANRFAETYLAFYVLAAEAALLTESVPIPTSCSDRGSQEQKRDCAIDVITGRSNPAIGLRGLVPSLERALKERLLIVNSHADQAEILLRQYLEVIGSQEASSIQIEALAHAEASAENFYLLSGPLQSDFETSVGTNWEAVRQYAAGISFPENPALQNEQAGLVDAIDSLSTELSDLEQLGYSIAQDLQDALRTAQDTATSPGGLQASVESIAREMTSLPTTIGLSDRAQIALADVVRSSSLLFSQVDRLQDPADPAWRILTDSENEGKWHNDFVETYHYAEGDSSVVIVRDTPILYRVQYADNDPTVLIESQLNISRAIANSAIAIAGGVAGAENLTPSPGQSQAGAQPDDSGTQESLDLAAKRASIEREAQLRRQSIDALFTRLGTLRQQATDSLTPMEAAELARTISSQLEGIKTILDVLE